MFVVHHAAWTARIAAALTALSLLASATPAPAAPAPAALVRERIKHVFVIFQENHSFDNYFGTYPGAENLATPLAQSHGFRQFDPIGNVWITPFRITDPDTESPGHSRALSLAKVNGGKLDRFVAEQEAASKRKLGSDAAARAVGMLTMAHYDCDTIPFLWKYAKTFALFDRIFEAMNTPSTPNNIEVIAAQAGQTQWARDPKAASAKASGPGVPVVNDLDPAAPPNDEASDKPPQLPQQYATLMLLLGGTSDKEAVEQTAGVAEDLASTAASGRAPIPWGWYQEGYISPLAAAAGYEAHHNAPQYFGYLRNNDVFWKNEHGVTDLLAQLRDGTLGDRGVFYVKGGSVNHFGWKPANKDPLVQANWLGDDDHPGNGDSDHQIGESFVATFVNAIARSKYWNDSAIVVAWDDSGGYWDHVPPPNFEQCADGHACGDGSRIPFIVISPYARSGAVVSDSGDTGSIVKFVETVFGLPTLASLPDERPYLPQGPRDGNPGVTDLTGAFDPGRLDGSVAPIPASDAEIPDETVNTFPPAMNCGTLGIAPVALPNAPSSPPPGFMPRVPHLKPE
jgi:phospholipase C